MASFTSICDFVTKTNGHISGHLQLPILVMSLLNWLDRHTKAPQHLNYISGGQFIAWSLPKPNTLAMGSKNPFGLTLTGLSLAGSAPQIEH